MRALVVLTAIACLAPSPVPAQKRDLMVEMQRDIALLQDQLRGLERSQLDRMTAIEKLVTQAIDNQGKITGALERLETSMGSQQKQITAPVAAMGSKIDEVSGEVGAFREQLAEINSTMRKMQAQLADLGNAVKTLQAPPAPPPSADPNMPPAGMTSDSLYQGAMRAKSAGQFDFAVQQFSDYLRYYPQTDMAANAQYQIGEIHAGQQRPEEALKAFDAVLERYPDNNKTLDAQYMKAVVLARMDQPKESAAEFRALIRKSPNSEQAAKAREQLKRLAAPPAPAKKKR